MTWTRWPAVTWYQSFGSAVGMNSRRASNFFSFEAMSWLTRYLMRLRLSFATASIGMMLCGRIDANRSSSEPFLRKRGLKPA